MDRNHDGVVTIDEFLNCCKTDQAITNSMLVFDSTIWPSGGNELEGTIKNTSSLSQKQSQKQQQQNQQQQRTTSQAVLKEQHRRRRQQKQHEQPRQHHSELNDNHINNNHDKTNNHIDVNDTKRGRKNKSPSIDKSFKENGPSTSSNQHNNGNILNHKMTNNIRNNDCQAKRIQLSSAAKRCKNINRSIVDNNPIPINDICSYDVEINIPTVSNYQLETLSFTYNSSTNDGNRSNTPPPLPSTPDSPTLVKVKTWYTQAVAKQGVIFWYWNHIFIDTQLKFVLCLGKIFTIKFSTQE